MAVVSGGVLALFLDYVRHFVLFEQDADQIIKKIAGYHQFHAVREAVKATVIAASNPNKGVLEVQEPRATYGKEVLPGSRKAGVVWHTQGSGKSTTMACYAGKLLQQPQMKNPTLVVVTDRNDLDGQLFGTFCAAEDLLRQMPVQAGSREELREMLASREAGGIIFTTVQKFALLDDEEQHPLLSDRSNIVVISDEAHRSHYGMKGRLDTKTGKYVFGYAKLTARLLLIMRTPDICSSSRPFHDSPGILWGKSWEKRRPTAPIGHENQRIGAHFTLQVQNIE